MDVATQYNDANPMVPMWLGGLILLFSGDAGPDFIPNLLWRGKVFLKTLVACFSNLVFELPRAILKQRACFQQRPSQNNT